MKNFENVNKYKHYTIDHIPKCQEIKKKIIYKSTLKYLNYLC